MNETAAIVPAELTTNASLRIRNLGLAPSGFILLSQWDYWKGCTDGRHHSPCWRLRHWMFT
jgi:hypothetical protein